jgi:thiol-disulfide isomerase/thioredoxin
VCEELETAGKSAGWRMVYLHHDGERVGYCATQTGDFEFPALPPGKYTIYAYGGSVRERYVDVEVPAGRPAVQVPPIEMDASPLVMLEGRPAPELEGVVGWKGQPVKLADLRGKVVLLDFWGYWCGPCVYQMPTIIALHERFKDRGLAIVTVHGDSHGEVETAAALDEKLAKIKAEDWGGRDLPFPVALTSGEARDEKGVRIGAVAQYGIRYFPTTVLIDRQGKVVGTFEVADRDNSEDVKKMNERVEKLLGGGE